jgi:hypothetical protein
MNNRPLAESFQASFQINLQVQVKGLQMKGETIEGKYSVELVTRNGDGDCLREVLYRHDNLALVRALFKGYSKRYAGRVIVLYDRARVLARSDT